MTEPRGCVIAGAGPAGLMLGVLLARAGITVTVLEKHADFLRDFRGDTIHPSTMEVMAELGWLEEFLRLPHEKVPRLTMQFGEDRFVMADLSRLPVRAPYIAMMPQWDFLNFLTEKGRAMPSFRLLMRAEATGLLIEGGRVMGLRARTSEGEQEVRAALTVAADGRGSVMQGAAGLTVEDFGAPMDVLWFSLPRDVQDTAETQGRIDAGRIFIMLNRGTYWQCAYVIAKGKDAEIRQRGLAAFRDGLRPLLPVPSERADAIESWDQVRLLTVQVNRAKRWWRPGFLAIGDAAHAMSPIGGVGVNLAVQDAVAAANGLAGPLARGRVEDGDLAAVERRRMFPTCATQRLQLLMQRGLIAPALSAGAASRPPLLLWLLTRVPILDGIPARLLGLGFRPEHVRAG